MSYMDWWQDKYDNLLPEDFEFEDTEEDEDYTEEDCDEQDN